MIRNLLIKHGVLKLTLGLTALSILFSVLITYLLGVALIGEPVGVTGYTLAVIIPAIIGPIVSGSQFRLLAKLISAQSQLEILAITDDLTQVYNRRYFYQRAKKEIARMNRYGGRLSIALLDFDNFKQINDTHGHLAGDEALRVLSKMCSQELRETDMIARYGGEEFALLFPETDHSEVKKLSIRLCDFLSETSIIYENQPINLTVSIGTATIEQGNINVDYLIKLADQALYAAKQAGGNTVHTSGPFSKSEK